MGSSDKVGNREISQIRDELLRKTRELATREEQFANEKLKILNDITALRRQSVDRAAIEPKKEDQIHTDSQKIKTLELQKEQIDHAIREKKQELNKLKESIKLISGAIEEIIVVNREDSIELVHDVDNDHLRSEIKVSEHEITKFRAEIDHKKKHVDGLKEKSKRMKLQVELQTQLETGNFTPLVPEEIVDFCNNEFRKAQLLWTDAQVSYQTDVTKFLENGIKAFLSSVDAYYALMTLKIPQSVENLDDLIDRVHVLSKANIIIRTSLVESLLNILIKMERGIDVVPQPSFVKEIRQFLDEIAANFRLESASLKSLDEDISI